MDGGNSIELSTTYAGGSNKKKKFKSSNVVSKKKFGGLKHVFHKQSKI